MKYNGAVKNKLIKLIRFIKEKTCEYKGHDFFVYSYTYTSLDGLETDKLCNRCGYDTREED